MYYDCFSKTAALSEGVSKCCLATASFKQKSTHSGQGYHSKGKIAKMKSLHIKNSR